MSPFFRAFDFIGVKRVHKLIPVKAVKSYATWAVQAKNHLNNYEAPKIPSGWVLRLCFPKKAGWELELRKTGRLSWADYGHKQKHEGRKMLVKFTYPNAPT